MVSDATGEMAMTEAEVCEECRRLCRDLRSSRRIKLIHFARAMDVHPNTMWTVERSRTRGTWRGLWAHAERYARAAEAQSPLSIQERERLEAIRAKVIALTAERGEMGMVGRVLAMARIGLGLTVVAMERESGIPDWVIQRNEGGHDPMRLRDVRDHVHALRLLGWEPTDEQAAMVTRAMGLTDDLFAHRAARGGAA